MAGKSTRTTGNDPVEGLDPGGTRPTRPGNRDKTPDGKGGESDPVVTQNVRSGDRNAGTSSEVTPATRPKP